MLTYNLANTGTGTLGITLPVHVSGLSNCTASVTSPPAASVAAGVSTSLGLTVTPSAAGAWSVTVSVTNTDANENPYNWTISGTAVAPELDVTRGGTAIVDGGTDSLSGTVAGSPSVLTYSLANSGGAALGITLPVSVSGLSNCTAVVTTAPAASVAAGGSTSLGLTVTPSAAGAWSCTVSIANTDGDESPYEWTLSGAAAPQSGLRAEYYPASDFSGQPIVRIDQDIRFLWGTAAPVAGVGPTNWSARWLGTITARYSETYTFTATVDDGFRLWIGGKQVINRWTTGKATVTGTVAMQAGQALDFRAEYYQSASNAEATLWWASAQQVKEVVPMSCLQPAAAATLPVVLVLRQSDATEGGSAGAFRVVRSTLAGSLSVPLKISGTAKSGSDFTALPASVTIPEGATEVLVPVNAIDDAVAGEGNETVIVSVTSGAGFTAADSASAVILDNDGNQPPIVHIHALGTPGQPAPAAFVLAAPAWDDNTVSKVEFLVNGTVVGNDTSHPFTKAWTAAAAGTYTLTARATDNTGQVTVSQPLTVTVPAAAGPTGPG